MENLARVRDCPNFSRETQSVICSFERKYSTTVVADVNAKVACECREPYRCAVDLRFGQQPGTGAAHRGIGHGTLGLDGLQD